MQFENRTSFPAKLFRTSLDDDRMAAAVVLRVTYEWRNGRFEPSEEQDWTVSPGPWDTPYGMMPGDELFYRGGVDLFVLGQAQPPQDRPVPVLDVSAEIGTFRYGIRVFGERLWQRTQAGLRPTAPRPIKTVPLTLNYAFGGKGTWDGLDVPFTPNPAGRGFYVDEAAAEGMPLPNIEDPANLIRKWDDRPMPVGIGLCPMDFAGRMLELIDPETKEFKFSPKLFNAAFPGMVAPAVAPGDVFTVRGVTPAGEIRLPVPHWRYQVRLTFDEEVIERALTIDQFGLELEKRRVFVSYRYPFRYVLYRMQERRCELSSMEAAA